MFRNRWTIYRIYGVQKNGYGLQRMVDEPDFGRSEREKAIKRMYELNGWKWKGN